MQVMPAMTTGMPSCIMQVMPAMTTGMPQLCHAMIPAMTTGIPQLYHASDASNDDRDVPAVPCKWCQQWRQRCPSCTIQVMPAMTTGMSQLYNASDASNDDRDVPAVPCKWCQQWRRGCPSCIMQVMPAMTTGMPQLYHAMMPAMTTGMPQLYHAMMPAMTTWLSYVHDARKLDRTVKEGLGPTHPSDPDMHHGTCVTHVSWCVLGSLTSGFIWCRWRGNVLGIPGACTTRKFTYLVKGPLSKIVPWNFLNIVTEISFQHT